MVLASTSNMDDVAVLRLRGLPFNATNSDIVQFFEGYSIHDILITRSYGKANGQAYVALDATQAPKAFAELNNKFMGKRYVEVFSSNMADMETARRMSDEQRKAQKSDQQQDQQHAPQQQQQSTAGDAATNLPALMQSFLNLQNIQQQRSQQQAQQQQQQQQPQHSLQHKQQQHKQQQSKTASSNNGQVIRLRGLPFAATEADVQAFLAPINLPEGISSIHLARHPDLRPTGEAYVHMSSEAEVLLALKKHKSMMGKRYIEVFPSCLAEMQQVLASQQQQQQQQLAGAVPHTPFMTAGIPMVLPPAAMSGMSSGGSGPSFGKPWPTTTQPQPATGILPIPHEQMLLAVLQQQQQQKAAMAARIRMTQQATLQAQYNATAIAAASAAAATNSLLQDYVPVSFSGSSSNTGMCNLLLQQQQQQQLAAAAAAALASSMAGLELTANPAAAAAAVAAGVNASRANSSDLQYVPFYSLCNSSFSCSNAFNPNGLGAAPSVMSVLSPAGSQVISSFASQQQIVSSAALDMMGSGSCLDNSAMLSTAAAAALCNESLVNGAAALQAAQNSLLI